MSTGLMHAAKPKISNTDFDCTLKAIKVCGSDDSDSTNRCLRKYMRRCEKNPSIQNTSEVKNHKNHHTYKTTIVVKESEKFFDNSRAKRICITDTNCNCKTIAKNKCSSTEGDYDTCVRTTQRSCEERCQNSRRCYRLDCKNAGRKRCTENVQVECSLRHPNSAENRDACVEKRSKCCLRYEKATCRRARRVYNFRQQCTSESQLKCKAIADEDAKCTCVSQTRQTCLINKVQSWRQSIRRVFDCEEASKIICSEKKCGTEYKQCLKRERKVCEPVCHKECRQQCNNQINGDCYKDAYKTCIHKWKRTYCKKRAQIRCGEDSECLQTKLKACKRELPACMTGKESCNDNNKCTKDICDPNQGCLNLPINCDDKNECTTDSCDALIGCVYKTKKCDDGVLCTRDSCNPQTGNCKHVFDKSICYTCSGGPCQVDSDCDAWSKSLNLAASCNKAYCNLQTGSCFAKKKKFCAEKCKASCLPYHACDNAQCVLNKNTQEYDCVHADKLCDDHKSCTIDSCDKTTGCTHKINLDVCPNNPICETDRDCKQWEVTKNLKNKCKKAVCDIKKGICVAQVASKECDINECQRNCRPRHSCETTKCVATNEGERAICTRTPIICDDKKSCTVDSCNPILGCVFKYKVSDVCHTGCQCSHTADCANYEAREKLADQCLKAVCDQSLGACVKVPKDGQCKKKRKDCTLDCVASNPCEVAKCVKDETGELTCQRSQKKCDDGVKCTVDSCDPSIGCVHTYTPDDINCPTGGQCKVESDCLKWGFQQKLGKKCQKATCDKTTGACKAIPKDRLCVTFEDCTATCQPANACETATCQLNPKGDYYCKRVSKSCDDNNKCTLDTCSIITGTCQHTPINTPECGSTTNTRCTTNKDCVTWGLNQNLGECQVAHCSRKSWTCVVRKSNKPSCSPCPGCVPRNQCEKATCVPGEDGQFTCQYSAKSCDDGKSCTVDSCDKTIGCINTYVPSDKCPADAQCKKNDDCVNWAFNHKCAERCHVASCDLTLGRCVSKPTQDKTCVPKGDCTNCVPKNACETAKCVRQTNGAVSCVRKVNKCNDGKECTKDSCDTVTGKCVNTYTVSAKCPIGGACAKNLDCKQWALDNAIDTKCLTPVCDANLGSCKAVPNGYRCRKSTCKKSCPPRNVCEDSTCSYDLNSNKLTCQYTRKDCDDKNACTRDSCDNVKGCVNTFDKTIKGCDTPVCKTKVDCVNWATKNGLTDNCQEAVCDSNTKTCRAVLINNPKCNPFLNKCKKECVAKNACETANCVVDAVTKKYSCTRKPLTCNDNNPCTTDVCDPVKGCVFTYTQSSTCEQFCKLDSDCIAYGVKKQASLKCKVAYCDTQTSSCKLRKDTNKNCKPIDKECSVVCKANNACDNAKCVRKTGTNDLTCVHEAITCNDNKVCTKDSCDPKKGCQFVFQKSPLCEQPCDKDIDCNGWAVQQKLEDKCQKAVCNTKLGSCKAVKGPQTSKCATTDQCTFSKDCPQAKFGTVCCAEDGLKKCCDNECETDLDCVPKDKKTTWGYCKQRDSGKRECEYKPKCKVNTDCNDNNPCTRDVCLKDYGFCKNLPRCVDNSCCTLDICIPGKDWTSYTCKNPVRSCTKDKNLLDKNYDLLSKDDKTAWLGKCSHTDCCITCVVNAQCDDHNGCTEDSCVNQFCVNKPIDNKWCDPKLEGQAITVEGYFPKFTRL